MNGIQLSNRLSNFPPYLFAEIDKKKSELRAKKIKFIDVSIGDPDIATPDGVIETLYKASKIKSNQKYALDQGSLKFRTAIKKWFKKRFDVSLCERSQILPLIGSKEGLIHFPLAYVNPGETILIPSPGYPGYRGAALFAGAKPYEMPLLAENKFLADLDKIPLSVRNRARMMYLNYPNNPTTALAPKKYLTEVVKFCRKYGIILAYDNAYSEIYFEEKPLSILEIPGAEEIALEFHSLSKTFCMTGFRVGWACGNPGLTAGLLKVKSNVDSGIFGAIQEAGANALSSQSAYVGKLRKTLKTRRDVFVSGLKELGFDEIYAGSTFYVWVRIPERFGSSIDMAEYLLMKKRIVATPGLGFGKHGEGFIRFAMTVDIDVLKKALKLLK